MARFRWVAVAVLLQLVTFALAHGHDEEGNGAMGDMQMVKKPTQQTADPNWSTSYSQLPGHSTSMIAHVSLMVIAWFFILPIGVVLSVARSRFALPTQFLFLTLNGLGVVFGISYNINTPDLYENNAHHKIGWVVTWIMTAQTIMSLLFVYAGRAEANSNPPSERDTFLPMSLENMAQHNMRPYHDYRWSGDSGQGTERSSLQTSRETSPTDPNRYAKPEPEDDGDDEEGVTMPQPKRVGFLRDNFVDRFLATRVPRVISAKILKTIEFVYEMIDRTILILGFVTFVTGAVTYGGILKGNNIYNGMAHFVKGGIFVWYGLLTLGRWMGCFADLGWAWNIKPTRAEVGQWKASMPSAEFVESFVIFLYGSINVFMEHLAAWGGEWVAQDLEHVSISIMFFGGGLCGMLVESKKIRNFLNTSVDFMPTRTDALLDEAIDVRQQPKTYSHSLNPMPGLIILLLGVMMSSHHQDSMVSTMVHKQWGTLLVGFSLARAVTYILTYIAPPTSIYPARPPSELVASFCLISGGLVFMASNKDIIRIMEEHNLMAMFVFTVVMGFTAFVMAYEVVVLAIKGWAVRRERITDQNRF